MKDILARARFFAVIVAVLVMTATFIAQAGTDPPHYHSASGFLQGTSATPNDPVAAVDALFAPWSAGNTPGAAVLVIQDGKILLKKGYGLANLETKTPITSDTAFLLASCSKQFTAMAIMILQQRGKLSYDDPLSKFFPEFPPYAKEITVREILNHTSGLPDYESLFVKTGKISNKKPRPMDSPHESYEPTAADALHLLEQQPELLFKPGTKWEYSNSGYVVLGQIVEKVSGKRYREFLEENIFKPLKMKETAVYDETKPQIPNRAASYTKDGDSFKNIDYTPLNAIYGEDNVVTTLNDMYRWDQALYTDKPVKQATLAQAFTPGHLNDGSATTYGFGWQIYERSGIHFVEHGGSWLGFRTGIFRIPEKHFTVVVLGNLAQMHSSTMMRQIAEFYLHVQLMPKPS